MKELIEIGKRAREASKQLAHLNTDQKNRVLQLVADHLEKSAIHILEANVLDLKQGEEMGLKGAIVERLTLSEERIKGIADGLREVVQLEDPIGEIEEMKKRPNGLMIGKKRVPLGVVGVIYESRPNVTADVAALCIKTGNVCVLRGGKEAFRSNNVIVKIIQEAIVECGLDPHMVQLVQDTSRDSAVAMMKLNEYLDILIPRGGAGLICPSPLPGLQCARPCRPCPILLRCRAACTLTPALAGGAPRRAYRVDSGCSVASHVCATVGAM